MIHIPSLKTSFMLHRIILAKFSPTINEESLDVNHKDLDKLNNNISNLEWCTRKANVEHSRLNQKYKEKKNVILSNDDIIEIYNYFLNGGSTKIVCDKYKIAKRTALDIKYKRSHTDILEDFPDVEKRISRSNIDVDTILKIKECLENNLGNAEIAKMFGVEVSLVADFKSGRIFKNYKPKNTEKLTGGEKLRAKQVIEIRNSSKTNKELAKEYNVTECTIRDIKNRKTWKNI